jgi:hypothetical protein
MNDEQLIWESYKTIISEADVLGRAYRMAKKSKESSRKEFSATQFYNYIKTAQQKAKERLKNSKDRNVSITVFHMINLNRLNGDKNKLIDAARYLLSKKDEEISVSMDTEPWEVRDSVVLVGTVKDLYEVYDSDTYTKDAKERHPLDIRSINQMDWDEVIINLKDVTWEYFYDSVHNEQVIDFLKSKELRQIYAYEDLTSHFSDSPRVIKQQELDETYKELSSALYDKYTLINKFYDFLQGDQSNAEIIRNSESFSDILDSIQPTDEYSMTELSQWEERPSWESEDINIQIPRNELGKRISEEDVVSLKKDLNSLIDIQTKVYEAWSNLIEELKNSGEEEQSMKIEKSKNLSNFTEKGYLNKYQ